MARRYGRRSRYSRQRIPDWLQALYYIGMAFVLGLGIYFEWFW